MHGHDADVNLNKETNMKLRLIRVVYFLALAVAFAVTAGADRKFG